MACMRTLLYILYSSWYGKGMQRVVKVGGPRLLVPYYVYVHVAAGCGLCLYMRGGAWKGLRKGGQEE